MYRFENNLDHQNNYIEISSIMSNVPKNFDVLIISLSVLRYFDSLIKLFSDLFLAKFLYTLAKPFFPYKHFIIFVSEI